jgi:hypothetical protein
LQGSDPSVEWFEEKQQEQLDPEETTLCYHCRPSQWPATAAQKHPASIEGSNFPWKRYPGSSSPFKGIDWYVLYLFFSLQPLPKMYIWE